MSASIIPFPLVRRRDFVCRHAEIISCLSHESAERHLSGAAGCADAKGGRRGPHRTRDSIA
jgi:hypothetical protein